MVGLSPAANPDVQLLKDAGIQWLRMHVGFPFQDSVEGPPSDRFKRNLERLSGLSDAGFRLLGTTHGPGSSRYDPATKTTRWMNGMPEWAGTYNDDRYYQVVEAAAAEMARQTKGLVQYWQIANEPDIDIFRGPLSVEQMDRFLLAGGRGIRRGNPDARPGINLGGPNDDARALARRVYRIEDTPFDYVGIDGYFGSWQRGGPDNWPAFINEAQAMTGKPVIIAEWGYSSLQEGPIMDDPQRTKHYNQDVCRNKRWGKVWRTSHSPEEQAEYVRQCLRIFADHPHCVGNFFFRYGDTETCWQCGQPLCPAECAWGMTDVQGRPKPAYHALKESVRELFA
jgi:hypothetical protein